MTSCHSGFLASAGRCFLMTTPDDWDTEKKNYLLLRDLFLDFFFFKNFFEKLIKMMCCFFASEKLWRLVLSLKETGCSL